MISIFDHDNRTRLSISWNNFDFNEPGADQDDGVFTDSVAFSTPVNFQSEVHPQISTQGGGIELYNPRVASRVLTLRARLQAPTLGRLFARLQWLQWGFSVLDLQFWQNDDHGGTRRWPPGGGRPSWVEELPLTFTRLNDGSLWSRFLNAFADGRVLLEYHVAPLELPDPVISAVATGFGALLEPSWLILDGGRAFARSDNTLSGTGNIAPSWSTAPMWPRFTFSATGAGAANLTIAVTAGEHGATLVVNASGLVNGDAVEIDTYTRTIWVNNVINTAKCSFVSGKWPVLRGSGTTDTVTWSNTTNLTSLTTHYRQGDVA